MRFGIDLGGTKIEIIALDDRGETLLRRRVPTPAGDYAGTLDAIAQLVRGAERELGQPGTVGVGIPGAVSPLTNLVKGSNSRVLIGKPLERDLSDKLERPVRLQNDANCFALSEATDGAAAGGGVVFGIILGTGTGAGLVIDGKIVEGHNKIAGEWGHMSLPWMREGEWPGVRCYCGKLGCVEMFLSGQGLAREHAKRTGQQLTAEQIGDAAEAGEGVALETLREYRDRLARSLAVIINICDPDVIVAGGGLSNMTPIYDGLLAEIERYAFSDALDTRIVRAAHGDSSGVRGAAWLWPPGAAGSGGAVDPAGPAR
jgi:fructokinase